MTIAACYLCPEGVVLGADSTSTMFVPHPHEPCDHYFNYGQKVFEIGENATLGITTWGLGSLGTISYRTLVAELADQLTQSRPADVGEVAWRWNTLFWSHYGPMTDAARTKVREIVAKGDQASDDEKKELRLIRDALACGFCIGGNCPPQRAPAAFEMWFHADMIQPEPPRAIAAGKPRFWGWSNFLDRLNLGIDEQTFEAILGSGKWVGSREELRVLVRQAALTIPLQLPIREAVDWVHSAIYTTIKAMKFSHFRPACGGPVEVAVITTDRRFRWVRHKKLGVAIR